MAGIARVEIGRLDYPMKGEFKFFKGGVRPSVVARLSDQDGVQGWGQAVPVESWTYETVESVESTLARYLGPALIGADPADLPEVHARMERAIRPSFSVGQPLAKAALDLACHDLWGRQAGRSVSDLLGGGKIERVTLSWTINAPSLEKAHEQLEQGHAAGYSSYNVKIGPPQTAAYDRDLIRAVRDFAPRGFHWADANTSYDVETALEMAPRLAHAGFRAFESPVPPNRVRDYQSLKRLGALPILMDEGMVSPVEVEEFAALGMLDGVAMKVARCGGLWPASRMVEVLKKEKLYVFGSGLTDPDLSLAASLHLFGCAGLEFPAALNGPQYLEMGVRPKKDILPVPGAPGLGFEIDESKVRWLN
jgi:muconate cycloisomerase